ASDVYKRQQQHSSTAAQQHSSTAAQQHSSSKFAQAQTVKWGPQKKATRGSPFNMLLYGG
ncbi:hypothetical protein, partial [Aeromonas caviae]|uniref:hypothetical protein n=1 Tax=Aeromonas caviae TaxID=648 RepID=UPI0022830BBD